MDWNVEFEGEDRRVGGEATPGGDADGEDEDAGESYRVDHEVNLDRLEDRVARILRAVQVMAEGLQIGRRAIESRPTSS